MKKRSKIVDDSLAAIPNVDSYGELRRGLLETILAIRDGTISPDEGRTLARAVKRQTKKIKKTGA